MQIDIQIPFSEFKIIFKREGSELVDGFFSNYGPPLLSGRGHTEVILKYVLFRLISPKPEV